MPGDLRRLWHGPLSPLAPPDVLEVVEDGSKGGGYYGTAFQGACGVTQGDQISPTIFNVEVDAVVRHWVTVMI